MLGTLFKEIACIGYGKICRGLVNGADLPINKVIVTGRTLLEQKLAGVTSDIRYRVENNRTAVKNADCVILAVKPPQLEAVCKEIAGYLHPDALVLSVVAGKTTKSIHEYLDSPNQPIARTMPNTPVSVKKGVIGLYSNPFVTPIQTAEVHKILNQIGIVIAVSDENKLNEITALSGCGPAYYYYMQKAVADIAIQWGFDAQTASRIAAHTMWGASDLQEDSGLSAEEEIARVASKGGATEKALEHYKQIGLDKQIAAGLEAALQQTYKLGNPTVSPLNMFQANTLETNKPPVPDWNIGLNKK